MRLISEKVRIESYQERHIPWVQEFNRRLGGKYGASKFPESNVPSWLPPTKSHRLYQEFFLAVDDETVRGAYILKHQDFFIRGRAISIAAYQFPISEGIINPDFMEVAILLTLDALQRQPNLFALGMGSYSESFPRLLKAMRWSFCEIPFYFKVIHPFHFLRKIAFLRKALPGKVLLDFAAFTGVGWLGIRALQTFKTHRPIGARIRVEEFDEFDERANILWNRVKQEYAAIAVRDSLNLNILYPRLSPKFKRIHVFEGERNIGWAVLLDTPMSCHKQFGSMRVGSIVDCLSHPDDAAKILSAAADYLSLRRVDIIISNHSHKSYREAYEKAGFFRGPSNFLFAASKKLDSLMEPFEVTKDQIYFMRGDGDGPINL